MKKNNIFFSILKRIILLIFLYICTVSILYSQDWEYCSQLPNGGAPLKICSDNQGIFCFSDSIFYKSLDNGINWEKVSNFTNIVLDLVNCDSILFVGSTDGMFRSTDKGATWKLLKNNIPTEKVFDIYIHNEYIYVSFGKSIYCSSNYGNDWELLSLFEFSYVLEIAATEDVIIVGLDNDKILLSENFGKEWRDPDSTLTLHGSDISNIILYDSVVYISTYYDDIWFSSDLCNSWKTYFVGINSLLKSGKEYIIGQNENGDFLNAYRLHGLLDNISYLNYYDNLFFIDFSDNNEYIFGITKEGIFRSSKCIFENPTINLSIDSSYCLSDTCFVKIGDICGSNNKLIVNEGLFRFFDFDSISIIFPDKGIFKFQYSVQNQYTNFVGSKTFDINVIDNPEKPTISKSNDTLYSSADTGNQWYLEDTLIVGAIGKSYYPMYVGNYSVQVGKDNCLSEMSDKFYVDAVSVENNENQDDCLIPNPASDFIEIELGDNHTLKGVVESVKIYNFLGELVIVSDTPPAPSQGGNLRIDVSHLSPGVYFVRIGDEVKKFVKY